VGQADPGAGPILRLLASAPPDRYRAPRFSFFRVDGRQRTPLRDPSPDPTFELPLTPANRLNAIVVEVREGDRGRTTERVTLDRALLQGL
jgi:hypothetical protein